ncbi:MAG: HPP family protein [Hyphomicrobium sp.]
MTSFDQRLRERIEGVRLGRLLGIELSPVGHIERLVSMAGGFVAILVLVAFERDLLGATGAAMLAASMGSTAVLLFAVPHGALSQPWPVIAGHVVSALVGVACAKLLPGSAFASSLAVGLSIGAMHVVRAIHPPAGATALAAVIGGPEVVALGFWFVVTPILVNTLVMVLVAVAFNAFFAWRRYPASWGRRALEAAPLSSAEALSHADFVAALHRIGTFVDISEAEFLRLRDLVREEAARRKIKPEEIRLGGYYSNGEQGVDFSVRRVVDVEPGRAEGRVIWRVIAGRDRDQQGLSTRHEFADWACCEVARSESTWVRAIPLEHHRT